MENLNSKEVNKMKTQVNEAKIFSTKDYSMFNILKKQNRGIKEGHVNKLVASIMQKNLLKDFPIIVSEGFTVLDGQHRLEAAKKLGLVIWYRITNEMTIDDIPLINSIYLGWNFKDYLNKFLDQGQKDYIKFKKMLDKHTDLLSISFLIQLIYGYRSGSERCGGIRYTAPSMRFKRGELIYPEDDSYVKEKIHIIKSFSPYIKLDKHVVGAIMALMKNDNYDHDRMLIKLEKSGGLLRPCPTAKDYFPILNEIYNYQVQDKSYTPLRYETCRKKVA